MNTLRRLALVALTVSFAAGLARPSAAQDTAKRLVDVPDYEWHAGCFGTATGNLMGYWDRHGMSNFYAGPTGGGLAPLNSRGINAGIRALWASRAGVDGRPGTMPGHIDDYWTRYDGDSPNLNSYESTAPDPYVTFGRPEHAPDCTGDFIGLSQKKWTNLAGECDGNIDAYSFVFWDTNGNKRVNFAYTNAAQEYIPDIQSGLREWTKYRGSDAEVFTQLASFNPHVPKNHGFTFEDVKHEIDQGYPVMVYLQPPDEFHRSFGSVTNVNPPIHGMMIYGYSEFVAAGLKLAYYRTSWGIGEESSFWTSDTWQANLPVRGVIGYRPKPKIICTARSGNDLTFTWHGPSSQIEDQVLGTTTSVHRYQILRTTSLSPADWQPASAITTDHTITITETPGTAAFFRLRLLHPGETP